MATAPAAPPRASLGWPAAIALLLLAAALLAALVEPAVYAIDGRSRMNNEGWNVIKQHEVQQGLPLYRDPPVLTLTNYPPVSFHLVAHFATLSGLDLVAAGRLVSLAAFAGIGVLLGFAVLRLGGGAPAALAAALGWGLMSVTVSQNLIGTNEPHLLGLFFAAAGLALHVAGPRPRAEAAAVCFALAVGVKFAFVGIPLALGLHMLLTGDLRSLGRYLLAGALASAALAFWTLRLEGPHAMAHLFFTRGLSIYDAIGGVLRLLVVALSLPLAAVLALWHAARGGHPRVGLLLLLATAPWPVAVFFAAGHGVSRGIFFDAIAATLVATFAAMGPVLAHWARDARAGLAVSLALVFPLVSALGPLPLRGWDLLRETAQRAQASALNREAIRLVAATPGDAMCEDLLVCFRAGKPHLYDPYPVDNALRVGRLRLEEVAGLFAERRFAVVQLGIDHPVELGGQGRWFRFPAEVANAIRAHYQPVLVDPRIVVMRAAP